MLLMSTTTARPQPHPPSLRQKVGLCQWFHYEAYDDVLAAVEVLRDLGVKHLRTGLSWADVLRPGGQRWYDWQMRTLRDADLHILLSVWHTPPSLAEAPATAAPPRRLRDYADFIDQIITRYGDQFDALELWNEPNNRYKWNFIDHDPYWRKFGEMVGTAAYWAKARGHTTVLGGMMPVDHHWLGLMDYWGVMPYVDVVAIHGFPEMWWEDAPNWEWYSHWRGWPGQVAYIAEHAAGKPIWVTETGLATWDLPNRRPGRYELQTLMLEQAVTAPVGRLYWYCAIDLDPRRAAIEGFHVDENEYHMGLVTYAGEKKPAYFRFKELLSGSTSAA
jgi:CDP-paratose 2-epimerase